MHTQALISTPLSMLVLILLTATPTMANPQPQAMVSQIPDGQIQAPISSNEPIAYTTPSLNLSSVAPTPTVYVSPVQATPPTTTPVLITPAPAAPTTSSVVVLPSMLSSPTAFVTTAAPAAPPLVSPIANSGSSLVGMRKPKSFALAFVMAALLALS